MQFESQDQRFSLGGSSASSRLVSSRADNATARSCSVVLGRCSQTAVASAAFLARNAAHRFFCAAAIRFFAAADMFLRGRAAPTCCCALTAAHRFLLASMIACRPALLSRRSPWVGVSGIRGSVCRGRRGPRSPSRNRTAAMYSSIRALCASSPFSAASSNKRSSSCGIEHVIMTDLASVPVKGNTAH